MKLSSNPEEHPLKNFPVAEWQPNDFMVHSLVDLSPSPADARPTHKDARGKKIINLKDALASMMPDLVKLPIVDVPRYKKVVTEEQGDGIVSLWLPIEFSSSSQPQTKPQEAVAEEVAPEPQLTDEDLTRRAEMLAEIEQKLDQANASLEQAQIKSGLIVSQARAEADQIMAEALARVEQVRKQAFEAGMLAAKAQVVKQIEQVTVMIKETQTWRSGILDHSEPTIIRMVQTISKKLFGSGFILNAAEIEQMVGRAINEANRLGNLRIYVNPEDHKLLLALWQESDLIINGQKIQLVPSQDIVRGGCFVEGEFGSVDSRIDMQLDRLEKELNSTLINREQEKLKLLEIGKVENAAADANLTFPGNLDALDKIELNPIPDNVLPDPSQEIYGFDNTQPE